MYPNIATVTLAPMAEIQRRFAASKVAVSNQKMHQFFFEPLMRWAERQIAAGDPIEATTMVQTITQAASNYRAMLAPAGGRSLDLLLFPVLFPEIVHAMLDDEREREAILLGLSAAFFLLAPPPSA